MQFQKEEPVKVSFTVPDRPTVRQQMAYYSEATGVIVKNHFERLWLGARSMMTEWECELFQKEINLDEVTDPRITEIMLWAAIRVKNHMDGLESIEKN